MKKIVVTSMLLFALGAIITSCGSSRKTGCPNNQGIVH